ncbi:hypothetical protein J1614_011707 [Plenodomus biglobosus]|nr:hypothetical protein J1614_011707 [Plenodomus biglobosus]
MEKVNFVYFVEQMRHPMVMLHGFFKSLTTNGGTVRSLAYNLYWGFCIAATKTRFIMSDIRRLLVFFSVRKHFRQKTVVTFLDTSNKRKPFFDHAYELCKLDSSSAYLDGASEEWWLTPENPIPHSLQSIAHSNDLKALLLQASEDERRSINLGHMQRKGSSFEYEVDFSKP